MKFGDRCITTCQHLAVCLLCDCCQQAGINLPCQPVHALAPGPEVIAPGPGAFLGLARQRPLKCVAVGIAKTRNNDARDEVTRLRRNIGYRSFNAPTLKLQADIVCPTLL